MVRGSLIYYHVYINALRLHLDIRLRVTPLLSTYGILWLCYGGISMP